MRKFIVILGWMICGVTLTAHAQSGTTGDLSWSIEEGTLIIWVTNGKNEPLPNFLSVIQKEILPLQI